VSRARDLELDRPLPIDQLFSKSGLVEYLSHDASPRITLPQILSESRLNQFCESSHANAMRVTTQMLEADEVGLRAPLHAPF
jgi:hypothetical protein